MNYQMHIHIAQWHFFLKPEMTHDYHHNTDNDRLKKNNSPHKSADFTTFGRRSGPLTKANQNKSSAIMRLDKTQSEKGFSQAT